MVAAEGAGQTSDIAGKLGIEPGMVVQELGYDADVDSPSASRRGQTGEELLDEDAQEVIDVVLMWFRDGDGDLVDNLVDARTPLAENGVVWVLTPKTGRDGHLEPSEIAEAATTAGLSQTSNQSVGDDWAGARLASPKSDKGRQR